MSKKTIFFAVALLFSSASGAGVFKDEVDRFTDNRSVSWMAMPSQPEEFSFSIFAFTRRATRLLTRIASSF